MDPPAPPKPPDKATRQGNEPPSAELEGEWDRLASYEVGPTSAEAHASGVSGRIEDVKKWSRKLRNALNRVRERSEGRSRKDSPGRAQVKPEDPGGETLVPGSVHDVQERPRNIRNERADGTDARSQDTGPGGRLEVQRGTHTYFAECIVVDEG